MSQTANGNPRGRPAARGGRGRGGGRGGAVKKGGPAPARHIPWPEIFKHHISLVEGHLKMIEMVRKHTVEGTGNHQTISSLVDRAKAMLNDAKTTEREFVLPREAWRDVPIGSASETMYPGYSPKYVQYGKAAEEFGKNWSEARKQGIEFKSKPDGPDYEFGQSKGAKRRRISEDKPKSIDKPQTLPVGQDQSQSQSQSDSPLFYFDSNPAPVFTHSPLHKATTTDSGPLVKKAKVDLVSEPADDVEQDINDAEPVIAYDNIDREVDARLKLKEDAKRNRTDKKRKRESPTSPQATNVNEDKISQPAETAKPAKKKKKSKSAKDSTTEAVAQESSGDGDVEMQDIPAHEQANGDGPEATSETTIAKKQKKKKNKDKEKGDKEVDGAVNGAEPSKKKKKHSKAEKSKESGD